MEHDLQRLIDDPRFREYHQKIAKRKEFNTFDVLRYADYEIRHSNVLAWLLQPDESHGIGGEFLKWFVEHYNGKVGSEAAVPVPSVSEANDVRIVRELSNVDVSVFLERPRYRIAIENKTVEADSEHFDQVRRYDRELRETPGQTYTIRSVLLTTSPEGAVSEPDFVHVSWSSVVEEIRSLQADGAFRSTEVGAFIRQYLDAVDGWLAPSATSEDHYVTLREDYGPLWKEMLDVMGREGDDGVARLVPAHGSEFRPTVVRLAKEFGNEPRKLRDAVGDFLKGPRKLQTCKGQDPKKTWFAQYWDLSEPARDLGIASCLRWGLTFEHKEIQIGFYLYQWSKKTQPVVERIKAHMQRVPINTREPTWYLMKEEGTYFYVYHRTFLSAGDLRGMSTTRAKEKVLEKLKECLDSDDSEYRRIENYFKCLAFGPDVPTPDAETA